jgi:deoxyribonuclease V
VNLPELHPWNLTPTEAVALQRRLAGRVEIASRLPQEVRLVAGVDASYEQAGGLAYGAVVVLRLPEMTEVARSGAVLPMSFPYVPGLLSFRELPVVIEAFRRLTVVPEAVICDGQGVAHPRGLGLAAHLGLWLDLPTVGCAKTRLVGEHGPPAAAAGAWTPLTVAGRTVGAVLTTRPGVKPVYVSPGHKTDLAAAVSLVLSCCRGRRLPEPVRAAHALGNELRRAGG